jgi:hypothetical protein
VSLIQDLADRILKEAQAELSDAMHAQAIAFACQQK